MEELDLTASSLKKQSDMGLCCLSRSFWQVTLLVFEILDHLLPPKMFIYNVPQFEPVQIVDL